MRVTREQLNALLAKLHDLVHDYEHGLPLWDKEKMLLARELIRSELHLDGSEASDEGLNNE